MTLGIRVTAVVNIGCDTTAFLHANFGVLGVKLPALFAGFGVQGNNFSSGGTHH